MTKKPRITSMKTSWSNGKFVPMQATSPMSPEAREAAAVETRAFLALQRKRKKTQESGLANPICSI